MANCEYYLLQDLYNSIDTKLGEIVTGINNSDVNLKIDELDIDLDNLEQQMIIANKLKFLDAVGVDIMTEEEQLDAYLSIKDQLFVPSGTAGGLMEDEEGD